MLNKYFEQLAVLSKLTMQKKKLQTGQVTFLALSPLPPQFAHYKTLHVTKQMESLSVWISSVKMVYLNIILIVIIIQTAAMFQYRSLTQYQRKEN